MASMPDSESRDADAEVSAEAVLDALARVTASDQFAQAERLKAFLVYVVEQTLEGRADQILGKTIAQDVYGRTQAAESDNVVRVDARRLRRRLTEYYATDGQSDPVRIVMKTGSYVPSFDAVAAAKASQPDQPATEPKSAGSTARKTGAIFASLVVLAAGLAAFMLVNEPTDNVDAVEPVSTDRSAAQREALMTGSAARLQAANLADEARSFLFPISDRKRQELATTVFRDVIRIDPDYASGYAGAAHSLATMTMLTPPGAERERLLTEAQEMADRALDLEPTLAWTQSAAGWVAFAGRNQDDARAFSDRAVELDPIDGSVLDFRALIALLTGNIEEALTFADLSRERRFSSSRFAFRNIFGVASFHAGSYEAGLASFEEAARLGDPVSELSLMYRAISSYGLGNTEEADRLLQELRETWPDFRPEPAIGAFYQSDTHAEEVLRTLYEAGWEAPREVRPDQGDGAAQ